MTAAADGQRQLVFINNHVNGVFVFVNHDAAYFGRRQRIHHELCWLRRPQYDVDAFAGQFVAHGVNTGAAHADTSTLRVDALVVGFNGNFGALAGVACYFADFQQAVRNFRHFVGVEFGQEVAAGTAQNDLFAAGIADFVHTQEEGADAVAAAEVFARNHFFARNQCVKFACDNFNDDAVALDAFYRTGNDVFFRSEELVQVLLALRIADALQDDLFGSLRGLASEAFVWQLLFVVFADLDGGAGNFFLDFLDGFFYVGVGVVFIGNNQPAAEGLVFAGIAVDFDAHVHVLAVGFFLGSSREGEFKGLEYDFRFNVFFTCQRFGQL